MSRPALSRVSILAAALPLVLCLLMLTLSSDAAEKKGKKGEKTDETTETPVIELEPVGAPPGNDAKVNAARIFLWYDGGLWHLRTRTKKDPHQFSGAIFIKGGKLKHISNYEGLEARGKRKGKKGSDLGQWNAAKNQIDFNFRTVGKEDGFDFELDKKATDVTFDLKIDGYGHARVIRVGHKGQMPSAPQFTLPAWPDAAPKAEAGKEK